METQLYLLFPPCLGLGFLSTADEEIKSFLLRTDPELSKVPSVPSGVSRDVALHVSPTLMMSAILISPSRFTQLSVS